MQCSAISYPCELCEKKFKFLLITKADICMEQLGVLITFVIAGVHKHERRVYVILRCCVINLCWFSLQNFSFHADVSTWKLKTDERIIESKHAAKNLKCQEENSIDSLIKSTADASVDPHEAQLVISRIIKQ